jgi:cytochrome oxidase Cu insertion factor (SCO1/SenC/PrrC family)
MTKPTLAVALAAALLSARAVAAQDSMPAVGSPAPDFVLPGATLDGVLKDSVRLSDFHDQTVVIAFFYQARTRG